MPTKTFYRYSKVGCWNIHGAYYNVNGYKVNKLEDPTFLEVLRTHDILCLQETQCGQNDLMSCHLQDFKSIPHCRKISSNNRYFGGMMLLIRKTIRRGVKIIPSDNPDILGILLLKDFFGLTEDISIWFVYAPPLDSPYLTDRDGVLDCLEKQFGKFNYPVIMGDLNGKTKTAPDYVLDAADKHSPINDIEEYIIDTPLPRNNMDTKSVDKQGKRVLELCQAHGLRILNGRTAGDRWGLPTRHPLCTRETPSALDYAICSSYHIKKISSFHVNPITELSDHCCISCKISTNAQHEQHPTEKNLLNTNKTVSKPKFQLDLALQYAENLSNHEGLRKLEEDLAKVETTSTKPSQSQVDGLMGMFNNCIMETAKKTFPSRATPRSRPKTKQPRKPAKWFNNECTKLRKSYRRALAKVNKNPFNQHFRELAIHARKAYKTVCKQAEAKLRGEVLQKLLELSDSDPKEFWKTLKNMREWGRKQPDPSDGIQANTWQHYYTELLNKKTTKPFEIIQGESNTILDEPLTLRELTDAINLAKRGKSAGPDNIQVEYIKHAKEDVVKILFRIMKIVFNNAIFPQQWTVNFLRPIYKKDCRDNPNNYWGLAIASTVSKLYCMILLKRLEAYMICNNIISPNQIGFCKGYRTSDHIFLLKTLITKLLRKKKQLFVAFIDFKKAYDTVDRSKLLKALYQSGVQGNFLSNLAAIYEKVQYSIKLNLGQLVPITSNLGLKQGCPLSPLLFNFYINDIGSYLKNNNTERDLAVQGTKVNHFLYADDLVLLSETKEGLQEHLDGLKKFSDDKELTVSIQKSVVMVFNRAGRKSKIQLTYDGQILSTVQSFTYLGVDISASGSFSSGIRSLITKAKKAMAPLFRTIVQFGLPFHQNLRLFLTLIEPILLYNAENWACMSDKEILKCRSDHNRIYESSLKSPTTVAQLRFLKFSLGVNKQCPSMAVLGETAEVPLILKGYHRMLTYWNRTRNMDDNTLVKKAYMENVSANSNWCKTLQILNCSQDLHNGEISEIDFPKLARRRLRENFIGYWRNRITDRSKEKKLGVYSKVKQAFEISKYLELPSFRDRQRITKFITSSHCLEIEKGRHNDKLRGERKCRACSSEAVEDERHFMLECPAYQDIRNKHLTVPHKDTQLEHIFLTDSPTDITLFLKTAFHLRDQLVNFHISKLSLCGMKMVICRGKGTGKPTTRLEATHMGGGKMRISRKHPRSAPYTRRLPKHEELG